MDNSFRGIGDKRMIGSRINLTYDVPFLHTGVASIRMMYAHLHHMVFLEGWVLQTRARPLKRFHIMRLGGVGEFVPAGRTCMCFFVVAAGTPRSTRLLRHVIFF